MNVLVTGAQGFVGRNLCVELRRREEITLYAIDIENSPDELECALSQADVIVHLAGVNRPQHVEEFAAGNAGFTAQLCERLQTMGRAPKILLASSIQAEMENPYGASKRAAEELLARFCAETGATGIIYRLKNLFGKWCRPNYNSVTATFCHHIAHDLPIEIADPARTVELTYIDDVVAAFLGELQAPTQPGCHMADPLPARQITLGALATLIKGFRDSRATLRMPDFSDAFTRRLYGTYLSYLDRDDFAYQLDIKADNRGTLAEFMKSPSFGQIFVSRTNPGITRGNHFHHTKTEKFMVVEGEAIIRFRRIDTEDVIEYPVSGRDYRVVDIPTGYTHSIENVGETELVTLFWACEVFDPANPETYFAPVRQPAGAPKE